MNVEAHGAWTYVPVSAGLSLNVEAIGVRGDISITNFCGNIMVEATPAQSIDLYKGTVDVGACRAIAFDAEDGEGLYFSSDCGGSIATTNNPLDPPEPGLMIICTNDLDAIAFLGSDSDDEIRLKNFTVNGDFLLGDGNDILVIEDSTVTGRIDTGAGSNTLIIAGNTSITYPSSIGSGGSWWFDLDETNIVDIASNASVTVDGCWIGKSRDSNGTELCLAGTLVAEKVIVGAQGNVGNKLVLSNTADISSVSNLFLMEGNYVEIMGDYTDVNDLFSYFDKDDIVFSMGLKGLDEWIELADVSDFEEQLIVSTTLRDGVQYTRVTVPMSQVVSLSVSGPEEVPESAVALYCCTAIYDTGVEDVVTPYAHWSIDPVLGTIEEGQLVPGPVDSDTVVDVIATYGGTNALCSVTLQNIPSNSAYGGGSGTVESPYEIASVMDLLALGANSADYDKSFVLVNSIDLAGLQFSGAIIDSDYSTPFTGVFDGAGQTLSNLTIVADSDSALLGTIGDAGVVKGLSLRDASVQGSGYRVSVLCAQNSGVISNCCANGIVSGYSYVGVLCADNDGAIFGSCSGGSATGDADYVGGLCGKSDDGTIRNCYSSASVSGDMYVGGLCGYSYGSTIENCYSIGPVSGSYDVGGLCGYLGYWDVVTASFWDTETSGQDSSDGGAGKTTVEMRTESTFTDAGWDFSNTWTMLGYPVLQTLSAPDVFNLTVSGADVVAGPYVPGTPYLLQAPQGHLFAGWTGDTEYFVDDGIGGTTAILIMPAAEVTLSATTEFAFANPGADGSAGAPFELATTEQFVRFSDVSSFWDKCFILGADIDLSEVSFTTAAVASFSGVFDGNGYVISNLKINSSSSLAALFGCVDNGAIVKNLGVVDVSVSGSGSAAALVAQNDGTISNCYSSGSVCGTGDSYGGLCAVNFGSILTSYSICWVEGSQIVGGLCGYNEGLISMCYSAGPVYYDSYSGGLCGANDGSIENSFWDLDTSGISTGDGTGATSEEMRNQSTFADAGWDFDSVWMMKGYPVLQTFPVVLN
jgi:hypothetical protein